ncbi:MAG: DUF2304 domain-containing protein [Candidatus Rokubacteria bacterium]|nr:DUF2304 domain-containing protein [Candidatus Rokubacteria bacterium]
MTLHQTVFSILTSVVVFVLILELIRRRRLREEYAWLWLLTGVAMILLVAWPRLLAGITRMIGAVAPLTTLLIFSTLFLLMIAVHYSLIISKLTTQVQNLSQEVALLSARVDGAGEA